MSLLGVNPQPSETQPSAWTEAVNLRRVVAEQATEIARLKQREHQLLLANNADMERRREAERTVALKEVQVEALTRWLMALLDENGGAA